MMAWKRMNDQWGQWHVGDPVPDFKQRVVVVQLDGHELEMLYTAMQHVYVNAHSRVQLDVPPEGH